MINAKKQLLKILKPWSHVNLYAVDPGATHFLIHLNALINEEYDNKITWYLEKWASQNFSFPNQSEQPVLDTISTSRRNDVYILGPQRDYAMSQLVMSRCKDVGAGVIFFLDHWKNLSEHFVTKESNTLVLPDVVLCPDESARDKLKSDLEKMSLWKNEFEKIVRSFTHLAIEAACQSIRAIPNSTKTKLKQDLNKDQKVILALLEPEEEGVGYTWQSALSTMIQYRDTHFPTHHIWLKPHPAQDENELRAHCHRHYETVKNMTIVIGDVDPLIATADEVWGITTIALIKALKCNKNIMSFQVGATQKGCENSNPYIDPFVVLG